VANIKSKAKRVKTNELSRQRNQHTKSEIRTLTKKVDELSAAEEVDGKALSKAISDAQQKIDEASSKGRLHKKQAARKISNLMRKQK
jgi:small subunit ribosomal protein S20